MSSRPATAPASIQRRDSAAFGRAPSATPSHAPPPWSTGCTRNAAAGV